MPLHRRYKLVLIGGPPFRFDFVGYAVCLVLGQAAALRDFFQSQPVQKCVELLWRNGVLGDCHSEVFSRLFHCYHPNSLAQPPPSIKWRYPTTAFLTLGLTSLKSSPRCSYGLG